MPNKSRKTDKSYHENTAEENYARVKTFKKCKSKGYKVFLRTEVRGDFNIHGTKYF